MVHPDYQRQGLGTRLLKTLSEEFDRMQRQILVSAAPAGVPLYRKFGFQTFSVVQTPKGDITTMLRQPRKFQ